MGKVRGLACGAALALALVGVAPAGAAGGASGAAGGGRPAVSVVPLDGLAGPGGDAYVFDINERGVAVGASQPALGGGRHPVVWDGTTTPTDLMPARPAEAPDAHAKAVNDRGAIAGSERWGLFGGAAYVWEDGAGGSVTDLPLVRPGQALDITNRGLVLYAESVGTALFAAVGLVWDGRVATRAPAFPGGLLPFHGADVNERGLVVGNEFGFQPVPGTWRPGGGVTRLPIPDGHTGASAVAVNDRGDVVGVTARELDRSSAVVRWRDGVPEALQGPAGESAGLTRSAFDDAGGSPINRSGDVAGTLAHADGTYRATLWRGSAATVLPVPDGFTSTMATALNDRRQVVGYGLLDGQERALLWDDGRVVDLTALAGETGVGRAVVTDINGRGQVVGHVLRLDGTAVSYRWDVR